MSDCDGRNKQRRQAFNKLACVVEINRNNAIVNQTDYTPQSNCFFDLMVAA